MSSGEQVESPFQPMSTAPPTAHFVHAQHNESDLKCLSFAAESSLAFLRSLKGERRNRIGYFKMVEGERGGEEKKEERGGKWEEQEREGEREEVEREVVMKCTHFGRVHPLSAKERESEMQTVRDVSEMSENDKALLQYDARIVTCCDVGRVISEVEGREEGKEEEKGGGEQSEKEGESEKGGNTTSVGAATTLTFVGFCGKAKPSVEREASDAVFGVDEELVRGLVGIPGMAFYTTMRRVHTSVLAESAHSDVGEEDATGEDFINLVAFLGESAKQAWTQFPIHSRLVRQYSHSFYTFIRLHNGRWTIDRSQTRLDNGWRQGGCEQKEGGEELKAGSLMRVPLPHVISPRSSSLRCERARSKEAGNVRLTSTKYLLFDRHEGMTEEEWQRHQCAQKEAKAEKNGYALTTWRGYTTYNSV
mmetsp:Transcript_16887/g.42395  ORF Transcript_16887/g.42395 Transcript_16887/m.42395 type:complete len:420 (-) Transcript_16887:378-1637(-)